MAGRVAWGEDRRQREAIARERRAVRDPVGDLDAVAPALDLLTLQRVRVDGRAGLALQLGRAADVVRVRVCQHQLTDALRADLQRRERAFDYVQRGDIAGVDQRQ